MAKKKVGAYMTIEKDCLVEIYTKNEDSFSVGKVFCQNSDSVVFFNVDEQGKISGYYAVKKNSITNILTDTEYLWKLEQYMQYGIENTYKSWFALKEINLDVEQSLFVQVLKHAKSSGIIVSLGMIYEETIETGYVTELAQDSIVLECVDIENADVLEKKLIKTDEIFFVEFESIDNILLQYANRKRNN